MKTIYVVRHAKSSWDNPLLDDFSRPLNNRGTRDAPNMAKRLKEKKLTIDLFLSSPATRALATAKTIVGTLGSDVKEVKTNPELYHASPEKILEILQSIDNKHAVVMLFGHNPGLTDFVNRLMNQKIDNMPTCAVAACTLEVNDWSNVSWNSGKLFLFDYPKSVK